MERLAAPARRREVSIAIHTHVNAAQSVTPLVAKAAKARATCLASPRRG